MNRRKYLASTGAAAMTAIAGCALAQSASGHVIQMEETSFEPAKYTVPVDEVVTWKNTSGLPHSVTLYEESVPAGAEYFASGGFDSEKAARKAWQTSGGGEVADGERYSHTFTVAGTYEFFCIPHEGAGMIGTITVEE